MKKYIKIIFQLNPWLLAFLQRFFSLPTNEKEGKRYKLSQRIRWQVLIPATCTIFLLMPYTSFSQDSIQVSGTVIKKETQEVLKDAAVIVNESRLCTTDEFGHYSIKVVKGATIRFAYIGFEEQTVIANEAIINIALQAKPVLIQEVIIVGTRSFLKRTKAETPAPVDVFKSKDLLQTGQTDLSQMINFNAPSFNTARQTISNVTDHIDPATLRGLGPDQVLVLINGKRRYTSALVNVNSTVGRGAVGTDFNAIPAAAIDRVEVLRDGASAQYGSDAIAGVVNLVLKKEINKGNFLVQAGRTQEGDGGTIAASLNYGIALGKRDGFLWAAFNTNFREPTQRAGAYNSLVYRSVTDTSKIASIPFNTPSAKITENKRLDDSAVSANNFDRVNANNTIVGNAKMLNIGGFYNMAIPLHQQWELYSFGGYSQRFGKASGFYRYPNNSRTNDLVLFPNGYLPFINTNIKDKSIAVGLKKTNDKGWNIDFSTVYGSNAVQIDVTNSINASLTDSLGRISLSDRKNAPSNYYCGTLLFNQLTTNINFSRNYKQLFGTQSFNIASGVEWRLDNYQIKAGEPFAWNNYNTPGTPLNIGKAPGVQVFGGFRPSNAVNKNRNNIGSYIDIETDITSKFLIGTALRFEHYSDFGSNLSGKIVTRYKLSNTLAIRAGLNRGFRAPSLHQKYYSAATTQFINVTDPITKKSSNIQREVFTASNESGIANALGVPLLKPEKSWSYSTGVTMGLPKLLITVDAYWISIKDRIVISGRLDTTIAAIKNVRTQGYDITDLQLFTNAINTVTRGLDIVATYNFINSKRFSLNINGAVNFNRTTIMGDVLTPSLLVGQSNQLFGREEKGRIEDNQPSHKYIFSINPIYRKWSAMVRTTAFGSITTRDVSNPIQDQTFAAKWITDASVNINVSRNFSFTIGANNLLDIYPDKIKDPALTNSNTVIYSRFATQFGFNGRYYFANLGIRF
jgi:iron complex outermembrane recepter protein